LQLLVTAADKATTSAPCFIRLWPRPDAATNRFLQDAAPAANTGIAGFATGDA
jgi:hypothetical protein